MFVKGLYRMYSLLLFTESKTQNSWDNFWLCYLFRYTARTDPWSIGRVIPVKPWCTGKQLPLGFNPMDLGSVRGLYLETGLQSLAGPKKGIHEQETRSTKYKNINTACQMARGQWLQATSGKLQAPSSKLDKTGI